MQGQIPRGDLLSATHIDSPPHVGTDPVSVRIHVDSSRQRFCQLRAVWILLGRDSASSALSGFFPAEVLPAPRRPDSSRQRFCQPRAVRILPGRGSASLAPSGFFPAEILPAPHCPGFLPAEILPAPHCPGFLPEEILPASIMYYFPSK